MKSLLEYWYEVVLEQLAAFINTNTFPIKVCASFNVVYLVFTDFVGGPSSAFLAMLLTSLLRKKTS